MNIEQIKQRFDIIGSSQGLDRALETAVSVAATDLSVLVTGESGVGKEVIPKIIHSESPRRHGVYIAVNCGAIPEGTIDSELFGHEKGSFTGATETRKGYFEEANGGTLFLDEVAELPLSTQVRLLRVLQTGEFIKVGSSKVQKTDVRVIAATNIDLRHAIASGRFREDLYYRLNTVPINIPPLRERKDDIFLLFRKFALDFADRYKMPVIRLDQGAQQVLIDYRWPGNVRQLKSVAEQISILEEERLVNAATLRRYLPQEDLHHLPVKTGEGVQDADYQADRDLIFKILFQLTQEVNTLSEKVASLSGNAQHKAGGQAIIISPEDVHTSGSESVAVEDNGQAEDGPVAEAGVVDAADNLSLQHLGEDLIRKALAKYNGRRKDAARELGISERTLYRKIKDLGI